MYDNFSSFQAFSYFHFLVNEKEEFDIYKVFRQYDTGNICVFLDLWAIQAYTIIIQSKIFSCPIVVLGLGIILQ